MDIYHALNIDMPQVLFTVLHQAGPMVSDEDYTRTVTALHMDIRQHAQAVAEELHEWQQQEYIQQARQTEEIMLGLGVLAKDADPRQIQDALIQGYQQMGDRVGSATLLGIQGSVEEAFREETPSDPDLTRRFADGRAYLASLGFKPGQGIMHETLLLFRGSIHYDVMQHVMRNRIGIYRGSHSTHINYVARATFGTYDLVSQLGESLAADLQHDADTQEVTFAFSKGPIHYGPFRQEVSDMMEHVAEQIHLRHASFWQRKLGLGTGKEFVLHLRLAAGEQPLCELTGVIAASGRLGQEAIVKRGQLLLGRRVL
jgi:hypothetical protein